MKLFNRTISNTTPTNTVKDYYQTEKREHKVVAWLLAFVTFIVTLAIILLLFFAGRWAYQKITKGDDSNTATITQPQEDTSTTKPAEDTSEASEGQTNGAQTPTDNTPPQTSSTSTSTPSPARQPNTGPSEPELVRTGPDLDL